MAWAHTGTDLSLCLCCCNQRHLLAVIFIFTIVMGAPHTDTAQRMVPMDPTLPPDDDGSAYHPRPHPHHHHHHHHHHHQQQHHHQHEHEQQQHQHLHQHNQHHHQGDATGSTGPAGSVAPFPAAAAAMSFATKNNTKVTAQRGGTALLPCTVVSQSSALVSWVRRRDFQLLTVALSTYSSDERFLVEHLRHLGHWALRIKSVRPEDEGLYECQLSVHPVQSVFVELTVVEAVAEIVGAPDLHIDEGSTLRLECKLNSATENPTFVFWYHEQNMVNFDQLNGFSVTPFQPPVPAGHQHLHHLLSHAMQEHDLQQLSSEDVGGFDPFDDDDGDDRSEQDLAANPFPRKPPGSSSSSLLLASLAAAALSSSSSSFQHLDPAQQDLSMELEGGLSLPHGSSAQDLGSGRPHNGHLHHQHHGHDPIQQQHHGHHHPAHPHGAWPMNYSNLMLYSHILTPAPSVLTIKEVHFKHAGNYTCAPSNARPASITVHVLQGEKPAAMQHANRSQLDDGGKQPRSGCRTHRTQTVLPLMAVLLVLSLQAVHNR